MRRAGQGLLLLALAVGTTGCGIGPGDDATCDSGPYDYDTAVAVTEELLRMAHGMAEASEQDQVRDIVATVNDHWDQAKSEPGPAVCGVEAEQELLLIVSYLVNHPDAVSTELLDGLQGAAEDRGTDGPSLFLKDSSINESEYPGMAELEEAVDAQIRAMPELRTSD